MLCSITGMKACVDAGVDSADATSAAAPSEDFAAQLRPQSAFDSSPLRGRTVGLLRQLTGTGVDAAVTDAFDAACKHLESLGAVVEEVRPLSADVVLGISTHE